MKATELCREKHKLPDDGIVEMVIWRLPRANSQRPQGLKFRLFYGKDRQRLAGYDNEQGKAGVAPSTEVRGRVEGAKIYWGGETGGRIHRQRERVEARRERIELFYLPTYPPELNPEVCLYVISAIFPDQPQGGQTGCSDKTTGRPQHTNKKDFLSTRHHCNSCFDKTCCCGRNL